MSAPAEAKALVYVTATFTAQPLEESLLFWSRKLGLGVAVAFAGYNQVLQELLDPASASRRNERGANLFLVRCEDWFRFDGEVSGEETLSQELVRALRIGAVASKVPTLLVFCPPSPAHERRHARLESEMIELLRGQTGLQVIAADDVLSAYPAAEIHDPESDALGHIPYAAPFFASLGTVVMRRLSALRRKPAKLIAVDADNTLWQGVVGEVGVAGVSIDESALRLHRFLREQQKAGVLLAVVSKNARPDVDAVFQKRADMELRAEDIVAWKVNWEPKSQNLRELAAELSLGLDTFVFLDDNPVEAAEVRARAPEITTLQIPAIDAAGLDRFLKHIWVLDRAGAVTAEDEARTGLYRAQAQRAELESSSRSFQEFLDGLQLEVAVERAALSDLPRLAQLTQRTNQFNATGLRQTEAEVRRWLESADRRALKVSVRDRFGDYGLVGFASFTCRDQVAVVDNFLLSCRALGKGVEHEMMRALAREARVCRCDTLELHYRPGERNQPAAAFLFGSFGGLVAADDSRERACEFMIPVGVAEAIRFESRGEESPAAGLATAPPAAANGDSPPPQRTNWEEIAGNLNSVDAILDAIRVTQRRERPVRAGTNYVTPRTTTERTLAAMWADVLNLETVGLEDDFFALGGDSVRAARLLGRINRTFQRRLELRTLFECPTVAKFVTALSASVERAALPPLVRVPRPENGEHSLSSAQRRMWFLDRYTQGNPAYHVVAARRFKGPLNVEALGRALRSLAQRQESLRTVFPGRDGAPVQSIQAGGVDLVEESFTDLSSASRWEAALARARDLAAGPFDLAQGPLARAHLIRIGADDHLGIFILHHIIADGWSMAVFFREWAALYASAVDAGGEALPPLRWQYLDLAAWHDQCLEAGEFSEDLAYWRQELKGTPEVLNLPTDHPRPAERTFHGKLASLRLPEGAAHSLARLCTSQQVTPFMVLMAAWQALLHRWSGQEDILVGTPVSGRLEPESEPLIGCFVNTVVLRAPISAAMPFAEHLRQCKEKTLDAHSHQRLPFDRLIESLDLNRNIASAPLFQVMFVLQNTPGGDCHFAGLETVEVPLHNGSSKFELVLEAIPADRGYLLNLEYNCDLFRADTAHRMLEGFVNLLSAACDHPATLIGRLPLLNAAELARAREASHRCRSFATPAPTLHEWFDLIARRFPDRAALSHDDRVWTYGDLCQYANRLAHALRRHGVRPGAPVALCLERSPELIGSLLGILKAGGCYVPIDLGYPAERLAFMLEDTRAEILLTERSLVSRLPAHEARVLCVDDPAHFSPAEYSGEPPPPGAGSDDLAYIIYTSGSTGKPKGCCVTHHNVTRLFSATDEWFEFDPDDVWTLFHSYAFDFSVWEIWGALLFGGRLVVVPYLISRSPDQFHELLVRERVTVLNQTPSAFRQLISADAASSAADRLSLRHVIFGGEAMEMQSLKPWFERHGDERPRLVNMYGITETTVHVTYRPLNSSDVQGGSVIGVPIPDLRVYVLDPEMQPCPIGVPGELFVGGAGVARGYLNRPELTTQRFLESPFVGGDRLYRTGDLARHLPDGDLEYLGRIDRQVKIRGFRIELGEIESVLLQHSSVREAAVVARAVPTGKQLVGYVVPHLGAGGAEVESLRAHLRAQLPDYMVPAAWAFMERFPLTANGKLDTNSLPEPASELRPVNGSHVAPRTEDEQALAKIWQRALRIADASIHDNFFSLGGDSILAIQVISLARQAGYALSPRHLFEHQTIADLAAFAAGTKSNGTRQSVARASSEETAPQSVPLTPIQRWFVEQKFFGQNHWNQAFLFATREPLDLARLQKALDRVAARHDVFDFRLAHEKGCWRRIAPAERTPVPLEVTSLKKLTSACELAQAGLSLSEGPLLRAVYARADTGGRDRLFLVVHHVAIDGVSWRLLLEELEAAYFDEALDPRTDSFQDWANALSSQAAKFRDELPIWEDVVSRIEPSLPPNAGVEGANTEEGVEIFPVDLDEAETEALLRQLPSRWRTRVDEILLSALAMALGRMSSKRAVTINLEGHGREDVIEGVDVSRTIGWFTTIFPVRLELPDSLRPEEVLPAVGTQLRAIPHRGIGYGLLRYLDADGNTLRSSPTPDLIFNYLGQIDSLVAESRLLAFADEESGRWHHPKALRAHAIEVDSFVKRGVFGAEFRLGRALHDRETGRALAAHFQEALREIITQCGRETRALTPADFPLVKVGQQTVEELTRRYPELEDLWPLSPMQLLFQSLAAARGGTVFDQWQCRFEGPLDEAAFRRAWEGVFERHALLRSSLATGGLDEPLLAIHHSAQPAWIIDDWRQRTKTEQQAALDELIATDARIRPDLAQPPLSRFALIRLHDQEFFFLWSVPDFLLDGWSWPVIFKDLGHIYRGLTAGSRARLEAAGSYRDYLSWLAQHPVTGHEAFWRKMLGGMRQPTPLALDRPLSGSAGRNREHNLQLSVEETAALEAFTKAHAVTPMAVVSGAWALLLGRCADQSEVTFGAAFSGRPTELEGVGSIVGPFVNNLPLRIKTAPGQTVGGLLSEIRDLVFAASEHQFVPLTQVHDWSDLPWRHRLFESLLVFQNYQVGDEACHLAPDVRISNFRGPIHSNFALTVVVTPGTRLDLTLVYQENRCSDQRARDVLAGLEAVIRQLVTGGWSAAVSQVTERVSLPLVPPEETRSGPRPQPTAPRTGLERRIHQLWTQAFGPGVGVEDNFFEVGGHSLLALRMLSKLRQEFGRPLSAAHLFQFPTVAALARHLEPGATTAGFSAARERAARARGILIRN